MIDLGTLDNRHADTGKQWRESGGCMDGRQSVEIVGREEGKDVVVLVLRQTTDC